MTASNRDYTLKMVDRLHCILRKCGVFRVVTSKNDIYSRSWCSDRCSKFHFSCSFSSTRFGAARKICG
uniref:Uncharacterized protein n=1 Tax=Parascaris univalens TaxID=6257 RepID=A0A915C978_PARUN